MPCIGGSLLDINKWQRCLNIASTEMINSGWKSYAGKFEMVRNRKAKTLYRGMK